MATSSFLKEMEKYKKVGYAGLTKEYEKKNPPVIDPSIKVGQDFKKFTSYESSPANQEFKKLKAEEAALEKKRVEDTMKANPALAAISTTMTGLSHGATFGLDQLISPLTEQQKSIQEVSREMYNPKQSYLPSLQTVGELAGMAISPLTRVVGAGVGALNSIFGKAISKVAPSVVKKFAPSVTSKVTESALQAGGDMAVYGGVSKASEVKAGGENIMDHKSDIAKSALVSGGMGLAFGAGAGALGVGAKTLKTNLSTKGVESALDDAMGGFVPSIESRGIRPLNDVMTKGSDITSGRINEQLALPMPKTESKLKGIMDAYNNPTRNLEAIQSNSPRVDLGNQLPSGDRLRLKAGSIEQPPAKPVVLGDAPKGRFTLKPDVKNSVATYRGSKFDNYVDNFGEKGIIPKKTYLENGKRISKDDWELSETQFREKILNENNIITKEKLKTISDKYDNLYESYKKDLHESKGQTPPKAGEYKIDKTESDIEIAKDLTEQNYKLQTMQSKEINEIISKEVNKKRYDIVKNAVERGLPVPKNVLKDFPTLQKIYKSIVKNDGGMLNAVSKIERNNGAKVETGRTTKDGKVYDYKKTIYNKKMSEFKPQNKTIKPIQKYAQEMKSYQKPNIAESNKADQIRKVYPKEIGKSEIPIDVQPPKVLPQYAKETFFKPKQEVVNKTFPQNKKKHTSSVEQLKTAIEQPKVRAEYPKEIQDKLNALDDELKYQKEFAKRNYKYADDRGRHIRGQSMKISAEKNKIISEYNKTIPQAKTPPVETPVSASKTSSNINSPSSKQSSAQRKIEAYKELSSNNPPPTSKPPQSEVNLGSGKTKTSKFRTNTIERATEISSKSKDAMPNEMFDFETRTDKVVKRTAAKNVLNDKANTIDRINATDKLSDVQQHEAAIIAKELEKEAIETGNVTKLVTWLKSVASKTRELARGLRATDIAWEKDMNGSKAVMKAQRVIQEAEEEFAKTSNKNADILKNNINLRAKNISKEINQLSGKTALSVFHDLVNKGTMLLDINLQLFAGSKKLASYIKEYYSKDPLKRGKIIDELVEKFGLSGKDAETLAKTIQVAFDKRFTKESENYLKRLLKSEGKQDPTLDKVMKLIKAGAYDDMAIRDVLKEKYGLPVLSQDEAKFILKEMDAIGKLKEGSRDYEIKLAQVRRLIEEKRPSNWVDKQRAVKNIALLGNPATQVVNIQGNVALGAADIALQNTAGNLLDKLVFLRTGLRAIGFSSPSKLLKGVKIGAEDAAIDAAGGLRLKDLKGLSKKEQVNKIIEGIQNPIQRPIFKETMNKFELGRGLAFKGANKYQQSSNSAVKRVGDFFAKTGKVGRVMENALYTSLGGADRMAKQAHFDDTLNMLMKGNKVSEPTVEMKELAEIIALERTFTDINFMSNLGRLINNAPKRITNSPRLAQTLEFAINGLAPYITTPMNIGKRSLEFSPLGLAEGLARVVKILVKPEGTTLAMQRYAIDRVSRGLAGTVLLGIGYEMWKAGKATGKADKNTDARNFFDQVQINPNSIKIGNKTIDMVRLQPISTSFVAGVNLGKGLGKKGTGNKVMDAGENMIEAIGNAFEYYTDNPMVQAIKKLFGSEYGNDTLGERVAATAIEFPKQYFPSMVKKSAFISDKWKRDNTGKGMIQEKLINPLKNQTPGIRKELPVKYGTLGQPIKEYSGDNSFLNVMFNPNKIGTAKPSQVQSEILRLSKSNISEPNSIYPNVADRTISYNGETKTLTGIERQTYQKIMGQYANEAISKMINQNDYAIASDEEKAKAIKLAISGSKKDAIEEMAKELGMETKAKTKSIPLKIKVPNKN